MSKKITNKLDETTILAAKEMLKLIVDNAGGTTNIGRNSGLSRQNVQNFIDYGFVPLKSVYKICSSLGATPWELSYIKLYEIFANKSPSFASVLKSSKFLTAQDKINIRLIFK